MRDVDEWVVVLGGIRRREREREEVQPQEEEEEEGDGRVKPIVHRWGQRWCSPSRRPDQRKL